MSDPTPTPSSGGSFLDKKISGIKAQYLIGFGILVAVGAYVWRKRKVQNNPTPTVVDTSGQAAGPTVSSNGGSGGTGNPVPVQQTNAQWARGALNAAIGNGTVDPTDGANAVSAWLNDQQLTTSQANIIAKITTSAGQPPEGVLPIITTAPPIPAQPVDNTPTRYIRNSAGSISAQTANGNTYGITYPEWVALGNAGAQFTQVTDTEYASATAKK